jgi:uncharacterized protein
MQRHFHSQTTATQWSHTLHAALRTITVLILCSYLMSACGVLSSYAQPQGQLRGCGPTLRLDIVATEDARQKGLMGVTELPDNYGMLFVFADTVQPAFWMKDTLIPLEVVFMSKSGQIIAISAMEPQSETVHAAPEPLPYALEVPQGWMAMHGVSVGDTCQLDVPGDLVVE